MTSNADLARQLRDQADNAMLRRKALLCASVALGETQSVPAAIKVIRDCRLPAEISEAAVELLGQLTQDVPAGAPGRIAEKGRTP
jgi:hypothetical protein